jgi:tRNA (guanine-N7-)-methyltransferase
MSCPWSPEQLDRTFNRAAPRLLDIGCGNGVATRAWAAEHPDHDVVALDLHRPGLARLLRDLEVDGPATVRVVELDALVVFDGLPSGTFTQVRMLFPDPWPKRRHRERRMVDGAFLSRVADLLPVGGQLHVATDWTDYANQIRACIAAEPRLVPTTDQTGALWSSRRPDRPVTAYEQRALDTGRAVTDLVSARVASAVSPVTDPSPSA